MKVLRFAVVIVSVCGICGYAQDKKPTAKPATQAAGPAGPQMGSTAARGVAEMQRLTKLIAGRWSADVTFAPSEYVPNGGTGKGSSEAHPGPGRMSLIQNFHLAQGPMGKFDGHAIFFYDSKSNDYKSFWCDSMQGCQSSFASGNWQGEKLVFTGNAEMMGKKYVMRDTFSDLGPTAFTWTEEVSVDGGPMKPSLTIKYTRLGAKAGGTPPAKQ